LDFYGVHQFHYYKKTEQSPLILTELIKHKKVHDICNSKGSSTSLQKYYLYKNPYSLRNVVSEKLQIPKAKTELFKKTFTYSEPKLWNEFLFSIWQASFHNAFKIKVKSLILNDDVP
jgi:hypothetical protein